MLFRSKHDRQMAVIHYPLPGDPEYWSNDPHAFDSYDAVILDRGQPDYGLLLTKARAGHPYEALCATYRHDFVVLAKHLRTDVGATCRGSQAIP